MIRSCHDHITEGTDARIIRNNERSVNSKGTDYNEVITVKYKEITPEDENQHPPGSTPLWREGYHFNGYDTHTMTGISISTGIRPAMGMKEEVVAILS